MYVEIYNWNAKSKMYNIGHFQGVSPIIASGKQDKHYAEQQKFPNCWLNHLSCHRVLKTETLQDTRFCLVSSDNRIHWIYGLNEQRLHSVT